MTSPTGRRPQPLGITELLQRIGDDNVTVQNVLNDATAFRKTKRGMTVTFITDPANVDLYAMTYDDPDRRRPKVGIIVWMPTELVEKARAEAEAESK